MSQQAIEQLVEAARELGARRVSLSVSETSFAALVPIFTLSASFRRRLQLDADNYRGTMLHGQNEH